MNFVDAEALMSGLCDRRVLEPGEVGVKHYVCCHGWKGTIKASWDIHVKDDTLDVIERYEA